MKFAKELEREAVPEWRIKYLNYKVGKKYVKAVARAINRTPKPVTNRTPSIYLRGSNQDRKSSLPLASNARPNRGNEGHLPRSSPIHIVASLTEDETLRGEDSGLHYGSFVPTPPAESPPRQQLDKDHDFELPAPAIKAPDSPQVARSGEAARWSQSKVHLPRRSFTFAEQPATHPDAHTSNPSTLPRRTTAPTVSESPSNLRRILLHAHSPMKRNLTKVDSTEVDLEVVRQREKAFYDFLDSELEKVESFYKLKEEQAGQRLSILRQQLHEMRNRRVQEMVTSQHYGHDGDGNGDSDLSTKDISINGWVQPIKAKIFPPGPNSKALRNMPQTPFLPASTSAGDATRDYSRRQHKEDVSYRTAKHKLKLALQEFYRGMELLKSYALLNRTAFRKLNKKYDKAAHARPAMRYMNEKVNQAWFVNSDVLDGHIKAVEDLYSRYFERGNHKLAAGKLRSLIKKKSNESGSSFLNGFLIGTGLIFCVEGLIFGSQLLFDADPGIQVQTAYLLQIYAGYFLVLLMFSLFCINCFIWTKNKINYPFIFELDQRSRLDWRRLSEFPSFFFLLLGICMWLNFHRYGADWLYIYYPVILIGISTAIIFLPGPFVSFKSRRWLIYAHWRLLLAGIYPVEFRDFFLGDIYCSLTYAMANLELFFCLYAHRWNNPAQCNSSHSRVLGFLMTVPPIWRFFQCLRRYKDTRNVFPHLVNGGKYIMTIVATVMLSLYRIKYTQTNLALFITFSTINSIYVSIWDLFMDFSLLQPGTRHRALRDILALKRRWPYYAIMVIDPVLRFAWIFYAIFTYNAQHSTIVTFFVAVAEVLRRGMWALFRVENEHCANVSQYKASRDVPLPYRIEPLMDRVSSEASPALGADEQRRQELMSTAASSTAVASTLGANTMRRRKDTISARSFSKILAEAHKQDFVKRRKPGTEEAAVEEATEEQTDDDEDSEEEVAGLMQTGDGRP